jgi:hypothetical protein
MLCFVWGALCAFLQACIPHARGELVCLYAISADAVKLPSTLRLLPGDVH